MNAISRLFMIICLLVLSFSLSAEDKIFFLQTDEGEIEIPLEESSLLEILGTGQLRATARDDFVCDDGPDECEECPTCDDVQVSMSGGDGSFSASPTTVSEDDQVSFSWTSKGAWECAGNLDGVDWPAWDDFIGPPEGSESVSVSALVPDTTYEPCIDCCNGPNCDSRCTSFQVAAKDDDDDDDETQLPSGCDERVPSHASRATTQCILNTSGIDCTDWSDYWNRQFGEPTNTRELAIEWDEYLAVEFDTSTFDPSADQRILRESGKAHGRPYITTISRCPGDFDQDAIEEEMGSDCYRVSRTLESSMIRWKGAESDETNRCELAPDETYYWNIIYTDSEGGTDPDDLNLICEETDMQLCGHLIQVQGQG